MPLSQRAGSIKQEKIVKILILFILTATTVTTFAQNLTFEKKTYDFGGIGNQEKVSMKVPFKNTGDKKLIISKVKASCGCTAGTLERKELEPGAESFIEITFNPQGKRGKQRKSVTFFSNDSLTPSQPIYITAAIKAIWDFSPRRLEFTIQHDKYLATELSFDVKNNSDIVLSVLDITSNNQNVTLGDNLARDIEPGGAASFVVSVNPQFITDRRAVYARVNVKTKLGDKFGSRPLSVYIRNNTFKEPVYKSKPPFQKAKAKAKGSSKTPKAEGSSKTPKAEGSSKAPAEGSNAQTPATEGSIKQAEPESSNKEGSGN
jgi:hypothetical protein